MNLIRLNQDNYRDYQRCVRKLAYSFNVKGEPEIYQADIIAKAAEDGIMIKQQFINMLQKPNVEMYCLKDHSNQNMGIAILSFCKKVCCIHEFGLLKEYQGKGIGTEFFQQIMKDAIQTKGCKYVELKCPFRGAQQFWLRMGFHFVGNPRTTALFPEMRKKL